MRSRPRYWLDDAIERSKALARMELELGPDDELLQCSICREPFVPLADRPRPQPTCGGAECDAELERWVDRARARRRVAA